MTTFIDESGDAGSSSKSSRFFRLAAVWLNSGTSMDEFTESLNGLKATLGLKQDFEFHFAKLSHERRLSYFQAVKLTKFQFTVSSIDKDDYGRTTLTKSAIHQMVIQGLTELLQPHYLSLEQEKEGESGLNEKIVIDECGDSEFIRILKDCFWAIKSGKENKKLVKDIKSKRSRSDSGIQLADMICGATGKFLEGDNCYYDLIRTSSPKLRRRRFSA
jgi:hypothetical protein